LTFDGARVEIQLQTPRRLERLLLLDFPASEHFNDRWWSGVARNSSGNNYWFSAFLRGEEIARIHIDTNMSADRAFGVASPEEGFVEIVFFEVAARYRRQGRGTTVIKRLTALYPNRRFAAFSEEADRFWGSLGWDRHEHAGGVIRFRPLYASPPKREDSS